MTALLLLSSPADLYLRVMLLSTVSPEAALEMYGDSSGLLPDSLKVMLAERIGMDADSLTDSLIEEGTRDPYVWKRFLLRVFSTGDEGKFREVVRRYWERIDSVPEVVGFVGEIYENYGDLKGALRLYRLSLSLKGTSEILRNAAVLFARLGECDSALKYFRRLGKEALSDADRYERRRVYLALAMCYDRLGDGEKALKYYKEAYLLRKDTLIGFRIADLLAKMGRRDALSFLAAMYDELGFRRPNLHWGYALIMSPDTFHLNEGIRELAHYLAVKGDDPEARNLLMHAFLRKGDTLTALKHARRAYELAPEDDDYRLAYAFLLSAVSDNPRKFGYLLRERDKRDPLGMWVFARFYRKEGDGRRATEYYRRLVEMDPGNVPLNLEAYWYARSRGDLRLALKIMRNLKDRYPDSLNFWFELGDTYALLGMPDSAHAMYSYLVKHYGFKMKDCELAAVLNNWAYTLALTQYRLDTAKVLVDRAYDLCELDHILDTKGWVYFLLGKRERAKRLVESAIERLPEDDLNLPEVYLHLLIIRCSDGEDVDPAILREVNGMMDPHRLRFYRRFLKSCGRGD